MLARNKVEFSNIDDIISLRPIIGCVYSGSYILGKVANRFYN